MIFMRVWFVSTNIDYSNIQSELIDESTREWFRHSPISGIFGTLMTGVYHRLGIRSFQRLYKKGRIKADKRYRRVYPQTKTSIAYKNNYIALFDFESAGAENSIFIFDTWQSFFFDVEPLTIILKLERSSLPNLIPNPWLTNSRHLPLFQDFHMPYVEVWHSTSIPVSAISGCFLSNNRDTLEFFEDMQEVRDIIDEFVQSIHH